MHLLRAPLLLLLLATSCAHTVRPVDLPDEGGPWTLPLLDPLLNHRLMTLSEFQARDGSWHELVIWLDTGAFRSGLPERFVEEQLDLDSSESAWWTWRDAAGVETAWKGVVVPGVRFGDLELHDATLGAQPGDIALLGDEILRQRPLRVDLDLGVAVLGGEALAGPDLRKVRYRPGKDPATARVDFEVDGRRVRMILDTGAGAAIDAETGNRLKLKRVRYRKRAEHGGVVGRWKSNGHFLARSFESGELVAQDLPFTALPRWSHGGLFNRKAVGLLGMTLLRRYNFRIVPERGVIEIVGRRDLVKTAAERIARWSWLRRCEQAGCLAVRGDVGQEGEPALAVRAEAAFPRPVRVVVGYTDAEGRLLDEVPLMEARLPALEAGAERLIAFSEEALERLADEETPLCRIRGVAVLDLNPITEVEGEVEPVAYEYGSLEAHHVYPAAPASKTAACPGDAPDSAQARKDEAAGEVDAAGRQVE